jgi:hypothetical protein
MGKTIECKLCGTLVPNVESDEVICWECVTESLGKLEQPKRPKQVTSQGYPKGWKFMKEFIHQNGTVYHKGVEQPNLKGTLPPTQITTKPKKTKQQKKEEKQSALVEYTKVKKLLKNETRKTYKKKLETKLKKLQKQI